MYVYSMNYELWLPFIQLQDINKKLENIMLKYTYKKKLVDYNRILHKRIFLCSFRCCSYDTKYISIGFLRTQYNVILRMFK